MSISVEHPLLITSSSSSLKKAYVANAGSMIMEKPPPIELLFQHAAKARDAFQLLEKLIQAFFEGDYQAVKALALQISDIEHDADLIKQSIRTRVHSSILLPTIIDRQDLLSFLKFQDSILDDLEDAGIFASLKHPYRIPDDVRQALIQMLKISGDATQKYVAVMELLRSKAYSLDERSFKQILDQIAQVEKLEHDVDLIHREASRELFNQGQLDPLTSYHALKLLDLIAGITDMLARAADMLRTMLSR